MAGDWRGKHVWIVGASTGIGAALAEELARRGAILTLSARSADKLQAVLAQLSGGGHQAAPLDITDPQSIATAVAQIAAGQKRIDVVVLNAGAYAPMRAWAIDRDSAELQISTNLTGTVDCLAAILPTLLAQGAGHIAIVASVAGYRGLPQALIYGATKAALINLAETLHLDLGPRGIKVQVINPGFVATPLTAGNDFKMPALISAEAAARAMADGMLTDRFEIHFPKRFTRVLKLLRLLPYGLYFRLIRRITGR